MPPVAKAKKPRSKAKPKLALKTNEDASGIVFGEAPEVEEEEDGTKDAENEEQQFDPLAEFRRASAVAAKVVKQEAEKQSEVERHLLCVFDEMEQSSTSAGAGLVALSDMLDTVSQYTAPLTSRAAVKRPSKSVPLQLPPVFNRDQFMMEMSRVAKLMDDATFEANVLGLFECFYDRDSLERDVAVTARGEREGAATSTTAE